MAKHVTGGNDEVMGNGYNSATREVTFINYIDNSLHHIMAILLHCQ